MKIKRKKGSQFTFIGQPADECDYSECDFFASGSISTHGAKFFYIIIIIIWLFCVRNVSCSLFIFYLANCGIKAISCSQLYCYTEYQHGSHTALTHPQQSLPRTPFPTQPTNMSNSDIYFPTPGLNLHTVIHCI